jgi:hypothetical protein
MSNKQKITGDEIRQKIEQAKANPAFIHEKEELAKEDELKHATTMTDKDIAAAGRALHKAMEEGLITQVEPKKPSPKTRPKVALSKEEKWKRAKIRAKKALDRNNKVRQNSDYDVYSGHQNIRKFTTKGVTYFKVILRIKGRNEHRSKKFHVISEAIEYRDEMLKTLGRTPAIL